MYVKGKLSALKRIERFPVSTAALKTASAVFTNDVRDVMRSDESSALDRREDEEERKCLTGSLKCRHQSNKPLGELKVPAIGWSW